MSKVGNPSGVVNLSEEIELRQRLNAALDALLSPAGEGGILTGNKRLARLLVITKELEARKALYAEFDALVCELAREGFTQDKVGDLTAILKDNYAKGNTAFTAAAVKRYDVEFFTEEQMRRREAKAKKAGG